MIGGVGYKNPYVFFDKVLGPLTSISNGHIRHIGAFFKALKLPVEKYITDSNGKLLNS